MLLAVVGCFANVAESKQERQPSLLLNARLDACAGSNKCQVLVDFVALVALNHPHFPAYLTSANIHVFCY